MNFFSSELIFYAIAFLIFFAGLYLFFSWRNILLACFGLEVMFNGINLLFVAHSFYYHDIKGIGIALIALVISSSSFSIGLILTLMFYRKYKTLSLDALNIFGEQDDVSSE